MISFSSSRSSSRKAVPLAVAVALAVGGCEAPFSPLAETPPSVEQLPTAMASSPGSVPVYHVEVNAKHGNSTGLPVNLTGVRNSGGKSGAALPVSVLGTTEFDLSAVDLSSLRIGDVNTVPATPLRRQGNRLQASIVDLNGDGIKDLMLHFSLSEMVANGNLFDTTTRLCLTGQGPGYILGGCGPNGPGGGDPGNGGGDPGNGGGGGGGGPGASAVLVPFGTASSAQKPIWAGFLQNWATEPFDQERFPGWQTVEMTTVEAGGWPVPGGWTFQAYSAPLGPLGLADRLTQACGLSASDYRWPEHGQMLIRTDLVLPPGASQLVVEVVVDDEARVYLNGTELTRGFQSGRGNCASYSETVRFRVNDNLLSPDGRNKLAVWAKDTAGYVNFFDYQVTARIPN